MSDRKTGTSPSPDNTLLATVTDRVTGAALSVLLVQSSEAVRNVFIRSRNVPVGFTNRHAEPGYLLENGIALAESERDTDGSYIGGVGMDGIYLKTPDRYLPVLDRDGTVRAFRDISGECGLIAERQGGERFSLYSGSKDRCLQAFQNRAGMEDFFARRLNAKPGFDYLKDKHDWSWTGPTPSDKEREAMKSSAKNIQLTPLDDLFKTDAERQDDSLERVMQIPIEQLYPFRNHPFQVRDDESMKNTVESVKLVGVLSPAIARPRPEGGYELVSGHRRRHACELAGRKTMPVIVRDLDDDAATILMVDSNLQRETILPSERAFAFKMKLNAVKHQGERSDLTSRQVVGKLETADGIGALSQESGRQVQRFIRLTYLAPELLQMVDDRKIAFNPAVELSFLKDAEQRHLLDAMESEQSTPSLSQAQRLKKFSQENKLTGDVIDAIMSEEQDLTPKIAIPKEQIKKYFPASYTPKQMQDTIIKLLEQWQHKRQRDMER